MNVGNQDNGEGGELMIVDSAVTTHRPRSTRSRRRMWTAASVVFVVLGGCTATGDNASPLPSTPSANGTQTSVSTTASSSSVSTSAQRAITAYLGMWRAMASAAVTSDWRSPELSKYATGDALQVITKSLYTDSRNGLVTKGAPVNAPSVSSAEPQDAPTTVLVSDCGDSTNWLKYRADDGQLADDTPGGRRAITAEVMKQADGTWKVTRFAVEGVGSC